METKQNLQIDNEVKRRVDKALELTSHLKRKNDYDASSIYDDVDTEEDESSDLYNPEIFSNEVQAAAATYLAVLRRDKKDEYAVNITLIGGGKSQIYDAIKSLKKRGKGFSHLLLATGTHWHVTHFIKDGDDRENFYLRIYDSLGDKDEHQNSIYSEYLKSGKANFVMHDMIQKDAISCRIFALDIARSLMQYNYAPPLAKLLRMSQDLDLIERYAIDKKDSLEFGRKKNKTFDEATEARIKDVSYKRDVKKHNLYVLEKYESMMRRVADGVRRGVNISDDELRKFTFGYLVEDLVPSIPVLLHDPKKEEEDLRKFLADGKEFDRQQLDVRRDVAMMSKKLFRSLSARRMIGQDLTPSESVASVCTLNLAALSDEELSKLH